MNSLLIQACSKNDAEKLAMCEFDPALFDQIAGGGCKLTFKIPPKPTEPSVAPPEPTLDPDTLV